MTPIDYIWPFFFPILAAFISLIHIWWKQYAGIQRIEIFLMWQLAAGFGLSLLWGGFGHLVFPNQVAESIGWPTGSPFQREVGMWDFFMGITGLLCLKFKNEFWYAMVIGPGLFYFGAGLGHVYEMLVHNNYAPDNAGGIMYLDLLYPIFLAALLLWYHKMRNANPSR